jgi:signal transduction histidine kinase
MKDKEEISLLTLIFLLLALFFIIDLQTELGVSFGIMYITAVLLSAYLKKGRYIVIVAAVSTILVIAGYLLAPEGRELWKILINRALSLYAIWVTAILLTRRKRSELEREEVILRLEESYRNMEGFTYAVSHDLRNPLVTIEGFSNRLLKRHSDKLEDSGKELLIEIRNSCKRANQLIGNVLAFSRATTREIKKTEVDMETAADGVLLELEPSISGRDVQVKRGNLPLAYGDPMMVYQVLVNLISNALKFTGERQTATIEIGGTAVNGETIYYVRDNGAGFESDSANKLFGLFERGHPLTRFEGTGLGLGIVKMIIEKHGGRVWAEGKPDEGATFYFSLPDKR